jgi:hypothetical protein
MVTECWKGSETVNGTIVVLSHSLPGKSEDNHKKSQHSCFPCQDLNLVSSECKSEMRFQVYTGVVEMFTLLWYSVSLVVVYWIWTH